MSLEGRTAVVVGGTSGLGRELALGLADAGADVVATGRRKEEVDTTADEIEARGRRTLRVRTDVTQKASLEALHASVNDVLGKVDILVNAAGRLLRQPTLEVDDADWNDILDTNLTGTLHACRIFGRSHGGAALGPHHQHRVADLVRRAQRRDRLWGEQGRGRRAHQVAGDRMGSLRRMRQRHRPGRIQDAHQSGVARGSSDAAKSSSPARPCNVSACSKRLLVPVSFWPHQPRASSTVTFWWSTGAFWPAASINRCPRADEPGALERGGRVLCSRPCDSGAGRDC